MNKNIHCLLLPKKWPRQNFPYHYRLIMRINIILLILFCGLMNVSAAGYAQRVSITEKQVALKTIFKEIRKQTGFKFLYNSEMLNQASLVSLDVKNEPLEAVLALCFAGQPLTYRISERTIIVKRPAKTEETAIVANIEVYGKVTDQAGLPIPGVNILVKGSKVMTTSNNKGEFSLKNVPEQAVLVLSYVGYNTLEISLQGKKMPLQIKLVPAELNMDELVITGIYERKKESFTGSSATFKGAQLKQIGNQNIIQSLKTLDPAFAVLDNNRFGADPNKLPDLEIRGKSSIVGLKEQFGTDPNQPLFILDGFETDLRTVVDLNMNRVESITLLKDAASTAIYGSRAANGVVVIETKRPAAGELRLSYSSDLSVSMPDLHDYNLMNATEKLQFEKLAGRYTSISPDVFPKDQLYLDSLYNIRLMDVRRGVNTYWLTEPLRTGVSLGHNLYAEGGDRQMRYGVGLNYRKVNGVMKGSGRDVMGGSLDLLYRKNKFSFSNKLSIDYYDAAESPYGAFSDFSRANPYYAKRDANGTVQKYLEVSEDNKGQTYQVSNPLWNASLGNRSAEKKFGIRNNFMLEWMATDELRLRSRMGLTKSNTDNETFLSPLNTRYDLVDPVRRGQFQSASNNAFQYEGEFAATFGKLIREVHLINAVAGWNLSENSATQKGFAAIGFPAGEFSSPAFANMYPENSKPSYREDRRRATSGFANLGYAYDNRYLLDFSYRLDGSSVYGSNRRFTNTWSVGAAWNINREAFVKSMEWINVLKLRASIGNPGNQNFSAFQSYTTYRFNTAVLNQFGVGATVAALGNPDLMWQKTLDRNIGLDGVFLGNRLRLNVDVYNKLTDPLLAVINVPASVGFTTLTTNFGTQSNRGINGTISFSPVYRPAERINWTISINARHEQSRFGKIDNRLDLMNDLNRNLNMTRYYDGGSPTAIWAVRSLGIDPSTGRELFLKRNGESTFTHDYQDEVEVGNTQPRIEGVIGNTFYYKGFNLTAFLRYRLGGQQFNDALYQKVENISIEGLKQNQDKRAFYNRWQQPGDVTQFKGISLTETTPMSSRFVQDEQTIMGESVSIGYEFNSNWIKRLRMSSLNMRMYMNDFFRISTIKAERGIDYPFARTVSFSLNVTF
jgi:TonB-linked SusC/RagA family outer membrane protein